MEESKLEKYHEEYEIRGMNTYRSDFLEDRGEEICDELKYELENRSEEDYYICDVITDLASGYVDIMNEDLINSIGDLYWDGFYEETMSQIGSQGDLIRDIQMCQDDAYSYCLYTNLDNIVKNLVYDKLYDLGIDVNEMIEYAPITEGVDERIDDIDNNLTIKELHEEIDDVISDLCKELELEVDKERSR